MRLKYLIAVPFLFLFHVNTYASADTSFSRRRLDSEKALKVLVGGHLQMTKDEAGKEHTRKYVELGIHYTTRLGGFPHPDGAFTYGPSIEFAPGSTPIYGFKVSSWATLSLMVFGLSAVYYTDFNRGNFKIRPEVGFGAHPVKLTMGLNIPTISNKDFFPLKSSLGQVSLNILLKAKTIKKVEHPVHKDYPTWN